MRALLNTKPMLFPNLSTHRLLVVIVFTAIFTMAVRVPADTDTWWHLRAGQFMVENQTIITTDPFSHPRGGQLWIDHGWLAQIFWYGLYALGGWALVSLILAGLVTLAFWFIWRQIEANVFVGAFSMILGAIVSSVVWTARPQMISFVLTAVVATLLHRFKRQNGRLLPWLPLIMIVWVNVHGGFAIGFMLMLAYLSGEAVNNLTDHQEDPVVTWPRLKHLLIVMVLSLAVVVINPFTWRMWLYPFQTVGISALRDFIQEWQSPDFHLPHVQPFALMLLLVIAAVGRAGRRTDWTDLALIAMWTAWALFAARNIAIFGLIATPILARYADLTWSGQWQNWGYQRVPFSSSSHTMGSAKLNWILLGLIIIAALIKIVIPLTPSANLKAEQETLPYGAVEYLREHKPAGPMFNSYNWGGYLIFKLWPDYTVYIDGRTDLYDDAFIRRYLNVMVAGEAWQQTLADDGINLIFVESQSTLAKFLQVDPNWTRRYRDETAVIFTRNQLGP
jgi:MFS family permease